jgi:hypothetical protein
MYNVEGYNIELSRGDTGALTVKANATLEGEPYVFGANDRALFSIKSGNGEIIMQKVCPMVDNAFTVQFLNADTDSLAPGSYSWDVRYVINPYYDDSGRMINGDQVITPRAPMSLNLLTVVGDV